MEVWKSNIQSCKEMTKWKPDSIDMDWSGNLIKNLPHGGIWGIPANGNTYKIDKTNKLLVLQENGVLDETHDRNKIVFEKHGYTVIDKP